MPVYMLVYSGFLYPTLDRFAAASYVEQMGYETVFICWGFTWYWILSEENDIFIACYRLPILMTHNFLFIPEVVT